MSDLLSDLRSTIEHHIDAFGALVYEDRTIEKDEDRAPDQDVQTAPDQPIETAVEEKVSPISEVAETQTTYSMTPHTTSAYERISDLIPAGSSLKGMGTLSEVEEWVRSTVLIPLDETRINPVFGVGNPEADLMVIGEAPGADEDRQGEPFVGRAGQLLTKILEAVKFERSDVYIANILKSRPPKNRDPLPAEVEAHIPILFKQISLIQPKILLCVGRTSGTSLLGVNSSLASMRGSFHDYHGLPVMVTYHPAALLRNPNWKRPTWEDVQLLRSRYDELGGA